MRFALLLLLFPTGSLQLPPLSFSMKTNLEVRILDYFLNPEPCQNGLSNCMPCSGPTASSSVSCFDLEVCIPPFFCSTTTFLLARLVRFGPQPILWSYLAVVSLLSSPPKKADSQSCAHRCLLRENPLTHRKSRRGRRLTCGAALFIGERK